jgi:hypothetical protein
MDPSAAGRGFITPVSRSATTRISTGVAIVAKDSDATLTLSLRSKDGEIVPGGQTSLRLPANGHTSRFIEELFPNALTEDFEGAMTITADSNIAAVAFQIGSSAGQFTPLPVAPLQ